MWLAVQNLLESPRRTVLTSLGLSTAVAGALLFFGFTQHTYFALGEALTRNGFGHLQIADAEWFDSPRPELHRTPVAELESVQGALVDRLGERVSGASVRRELSGMITAQGRSGAFLGVGTDPSAEDALAPLARPVEGVGLAGASPDGVVLGAPLAQRIGVEPGDWLTVLVTTDQGLTNAADFRLVGLARTGVPMLDRTLARFPLTAVLGLAAGERADLLVVALRDTKDTGDALAAARAVLEDHPGLRVMPWFERAKYYIAVKALYDRLFAIFQVLILAVAGLTLSHAVAAVVTQRRAEIALLRVIGLTRHQVMWLFLLEGALLGLLGGGIGALLANGVALLTRSLGGIPMPPPPGFAVGYAAQFLLLADGYLLVLPVAVLTAMAASAVPAWRAARGALSRALMGLAALMVLSGPRAGPHLLEAVSQGDGGDLYVGCDDIGNE